MFSYSFLTVISNTDITLRDRRFHFQSSQTWVFSTMSIIKRVTHNETTTPFYLYDPSLAVAIVAAVLYTIAFLLTTIQWIRYRAWVWSIMVLSAASTFAFGLSFNQANLPLSGSSRLHWPMRLGPKYVREARLRASICPHHPCTRPHGSVLLCHLRSYFISYRSPRGTHASTMLGTPPIYYTHLRRV